MDFLNLVENRYSCRKFTDENLTKEQLKTILEAGRLAPSAVNRQPWRFLVVQSEEGLQKVDECSKCRYGAPTAILVCFDIGASAKNEDVVPDYGWVDCGIAIGEMALAAESVGIGSCIVGAYDPEKAIELFNIPPNIVPFQFLMLGNADPSMGPSPMHEKRFTLDELTTYESF